MALKQKTEERTKLLSQLEQAKMQEKVADSISSMNKLTANDDSPNLDQVRDKRARAVAISLAATGLDEDRLLTLRHVLESHGGGVPVVFVLTQPAAFQAEVKPSPELKVTPGPALTQAVEAVLGPGTLKLRVGP